MRWCLARSVCLRAAVRVLAASAFLSAQAPTGTVSGRVTDAAATTPISGATVRVIGTTLGASTAADGRYVIRGVPAGTVRLQVNRIGFEVKTTSVAVLAGQ